MNDHLRDLTTIADSRRFQLGVARNFTEVDNGARLLFLRSRSATDPLLCLWQLDLTDGRESLLIDPSVLVDEPTTAVPPEELDLRERRREYSEGIVEFSIDQAGRRLCFALAGKLFVFDRTDGRIGELSVESGVVDPRIDPAGERIAFVSAGALIVCDLGGRVIHRFAATDRSYGVAEFVVAEELGRQRGHWWSPDGSELLIASVDEREVSLWWPPAPESPWLAPRPRAYPCAGRPNATVALELVRRDGTTQTLDWDRTAFPYLVDVLWPDREHLTVTVMSRDQHDMRSLLVAADGRITRVIDTQHDDSWVWRIPGTPSWMPDGRLLTGRHVDDTASLFLDADRITPPGLQVAAVAGVGDGHVVFTATTDPLEQRVFSYRLRDGHLNELSEDAGLHECAVGPNTTVLISESLDSDERRVVVSSHEGSRRPVRSHHVGTSAAPNVRFLKLGERALRAALLMPPDARRTAGPLPVLLDPYGGPLSQRVQATRRHFYEPQWFADLGCAVLVIDGRGSPSRGPAWERAFRGDVLSPALADQIDGLHATADLLPGELDTRRVAIRGWSFGGYLAAAAVLRHPDVFTAAIAGAPVSDWRWYDSVASERYLGDPDNDQDAYERTSLLAEAASLRQPLLLIHGLADDNVYPVHSYALADQMNAAQAPVKLVTLPRTTHVVRDPATLRSLLMLQATFLHQTIGVQRPDTVASHAANVEIRG